MSRIEVPGTYFEDGFCNFVSEDLQHTTEACSYGMERLFGIPVGERRRIWFCVDTDVPVDGSGYARIDGIPSDAYLAPFGFEHGVVVGDTAFRVSWYLRNELMRRATPAQQPLLGCNPFYFWLEYEE